MADSGQKWSEVVDEDVTSSSNLSGSTGTDNMMQCCLCNVDVPETLKNIHESSEKHMINLKIINIALKRMADHNLTTVQDHHQTDNINYCGVCSIVVTDNEKNHETSNEHNLSMKHDLLLKTFLSVYEDKNKITDINFNCYPNTFEHINTDENIKSLRQYFKHEKGVKITVIDERTIKLNSRVGTLHFDINNFHGLSSVEDHLQCILCSVSVDDVQTHISNDLHVKRIKVGLMKYCIRKFDEENHHCIPCNEIISNVEDHIPQEKHRELLNKALITTNFCDICNCYVSSKFKESHCMGMKHKLKASGRHCEYDVMTKYYMQFDKLSGQYNCRICQVTLNNLDESGMHVKGQEHLTAYQEMMTKNAIFPFKNKFGCGACDIYIIEELITSHIFNKLHICNLNLLSTMTDENYMFQTAVTAGENYMFEPTFGGARKCRICSVKIRFHCLKLHLNSRSHNDKYQTFLAYNQLRKRNGHYYCEKCEESVPMKTEIDHVGQIKHVDKMKEPLSWRVRREPENVTYNTAIENRYIKDENVTETASASHVSKDTVSPNFDVKACTSEAKESNIDDNDKVVSGNARNNAGIGNATANADNKPSHLKLNPVTAENNVSYQTFMKMNKITLLLDNTYSCGICDVIMNFNYTPIKRHIRDSMHKLNVSLIFGDETSGKSSNDSSNAKNSIKSEDVTINEAISDETDFFQTNNSNRNLFNEKWKNFVNNNYALLPDFVKDEVKNVIIKKEHCLFCKVCDVYIVGDEDTAKSAHLKSETHISKTTGIKDDKEIGNTTDVLAETDVRVENITDCNTRTFADNFLEYKQGKPFCVLCCYFTGNNISYHSMTQSHQRKFDEFLDIYNLTQKNGHYFCATCKVYVRCSLPDHVIMYHDKSLFEARYSKNRQPPNHFALTINVDELWCKICQSTIENKKHLVLAHKKSDDHKLNYDNLLIRNAISKGKKKRNQCKVCNRNVKKDRIVYHLESVEHTHKINEHYMKMNGTLYNASAINITAESSNNQSINNRENDAVSAKNEPDLEINESDDSSEEVILEAPHLCN